MKKQILLTLMSLSIFACVTNNSPIINTNIEKFDTEKGSSYSFKTQANLTEAELVADLNNLRKKNNSLLLVNRVVFYKTNYPALFASAMTNNPALQSALKWNTGVMATMKKDVTFANFVNNITPSATPTPLSTPTPTPLSTPTINQGNVTTVAGSGVAGFFDAQGTNAKFNSPNGVAVDSTGNLFVADTGNQKIRKIDTLGNVTTVAGSGGAVFVDAQGTNAQFNNPNGVAVDSTGNLFVADSVNRKIRKIDTAGNVTTFAGSTSGFLDAQGTNAKFASPNGITVDSTGNLFVADMGNNRIRKIDTLGNVTTVAGSTRGFFDAQGTNAQFYYPNGVAVDSTGNLFVADTYNHKIRKIDTLGNVTTVAGSTYGFADGTYATAKFAYPNGITVDSTGNLFVADTFNNKIRKIDTLGNVTTVAGSTVGFFDAQGTNANFNYPNGVAVDSNGNIFVADSGNNNIRKIQ